MLYNQVEEAPVLGPDKLLYFLWEKFTMLTCVPGYGLDLNSPQSIKC